MHWQVTEAGDGVEVWGTAEVHTDVETKRRLWTGVFDYDLDQFAPGGADGLAGHGVRRRAPRAGALPGDVRHEGSLDVVGVIAAGPDADTPLVPSPAWPASIPRSGPACRTGRSPTSTRRAGAGCRSTTPAHVRNALARFGQVAFDDETAREQARTRLLNAAKKYKIVPIGFIAGQLQSERALGQRRRRRATLPAGFVTMLMTDIEGSTALVQRARSSATAS